MKVQVVLSVTSAKRLSVEVCELDLQYRLVFKHSMHAPGDSPIGDREFFDEPEEGPQPHPCIEFLERSLDEEKRSHKNFERDLRRQLLEMSLKEEENHHDLETLRAEVGIMREAISMYRQELDRVRNELTGMGRRCASLENDMQVTIARGDEEISRLKAALKQERQRTGTR